MSSTKSSYQNTDREQVAQELLEAFKQGRQGINFTNARPYVAGTFRGEDIYLCNDTAWNRGIRDLAAALRGILASPGQEGLGEYDEYHDLASRINELVREEIYTNGQWK